MRFWRDLWISTVGLFKWILESLFVGDILTPRRFVLRHYRKDDE
jgi:hypothetical protein